ncbi:MAG: YggS family pyridoxal phosphate-dependent enzyme [Vicinamibacterales bacterium]
MPDSSELVSRLNGVRDRIADAVRRSGRPPSSVRLVAVSKTFPIDAIRTAATAGQLEFGENKVQEGQAKIPALGGLPLRWHLVGHLQSNKARKAAALFDVIHSVDSADLLRTLNEGAADRRRTIDVLIQVDLAREPTKHGVPVEQVPSLIEAAGSCEAARLVGLMILPPPLGPEGTRPYFAALRTLRDDLVRSGVPEPTLRELSMGMSDDFETAIEEGATMVRVGSAIFGERDYR